MKRAAPFRFAVPIAAALLSAGLVVVPGLHDYLILHHAARGARFLTTGDFAIPTDHLLRMSMEMSEFRHGGAVMLVNAPGEVLYSIISTSIHGSRWYPASINPALWRIFSSWFCALPAWFFLGRAMDALCAGTRLRRADLVIGLSFFVVFLALSAGLRFSLAPEERASDDTFLWSSIYGFALWAGLMTIPVIAWLSQHKYLRLTCSR